jgi:signal transduction histidine kinase/CheY-like chemotaxis protein
LASAGEWVWLHQIGRVTEWTAGGEPSRLTGTYSDVTERKRVENDLRAANQELLRQKQLAEDATRAKSQSLACMSHEIRTPLNGVLGLTELLLKTPLTEDQRLLVQTAHSSGEILMRLLNDILDFSKIEAGKLELEQEPFQIASAVRGAVDLLAVQGRSKGLAINLHIDPGADLTVLGDAARVKQIVGNLLSNAIKFTHQGFVSVRLDVNGDSGSQRSFEITVRDSGIGMPEQTQRRIFNPFAQADLSTAREYGGTGLGLTIVKRLAELMHGAVSVSSVPGSGSTFCVRIPLAVAATAGPALANPGALAPSHHTQWRILVAEDNQTNQLLLRRLLENAGYLVDIAEDGMEALAALRARDYHLVLMDARMPRLDGLAATREIRALSEPKCRVPVIALTANAFAKDRDLCLAAGMDDYVSKPFAGEHLLAKCRDWLLRSTNSLARSAAH